jgi:hypothetical protein
MLRLRLYILYSIMLVFLTPKDNKSTFILPFGHKGLKSLTWKFYLDKLSRPVLWLIAFIDLVIALPILFFMLKSLLTPPFNLPQVSILTNVLIVGVILLMFYVLVNLLLDSMKLIYYLVTGHRIRTKPTAGQS